MEKSLAEKIEALYPGAVSSRAAMVQDNLDGTGPFIAQWHADRIGAPKPTIAAVNAAYLAQFPNG